VDVGNYIFHSFISLDYFNSNCNCSYSYIFLYCFSTYSNPSHVFASDVVHILSNPVLLYFRQ